MAGQLPRLAAGAVAIAGRIENHRVVAADSGECLVSRTSWHHRQSSGWTIFQARKVPRYAAPGNDVPRRVNVGDFGPAGRGRERAAASIGKEINDLDRTRKTRLRRAVCCEIHLQFSVCSGNRPTWPKSVRFISKTSGPQVIVQLARRRGTRLRVAKGPLALLALAAIEAGIEQRARAVDATRQTAF